MCSSTRGPAIWPSLVTWPISSSAVPRRLAKRISSCALVRSWVTVPGAARRCRRTWSGSDRSPPAGACADRRWPGCRAPRSPRQLDRRRRHPEPRGAQPDLVDRLLAADVGDLARRASAAAAWSTSVDLPMPGSPPIRTAEPCDQPPPSTRSSSAIAAGRRAGRPRRPASPTSSSRLPCRAALAAPGSPPLLDERVPLAAGVAAPGPARDRRRSSGRRSALRRAIRPSDRGRRRSGSALGAAVDELVDVRVAAWRRSAGRPRPDDPAVVEHGHAVGDLAHAGHVVGDREGGGAQACARSARSAR